MNTQLRRRTALSDAIESISGGTATVRKAVDSIRKFSSTYGLEER